MREPRGARGGIVISDDAPPTAPIVPVFSFRGRLPAPLWWVYRALRTVMVASAFAGFWGGAVFLAWIGLPLVALFTGSRRQRACQRVVAFAFRIFHGYMRWLRLFEVKVVGQFPADLARSPVVFVANHTTLVDVTAIFSEVPDLCCVAKAVYSSNPLVGRLLRLSGFIDSGKTVAQRAASVDEAVRMLADRFSVLVFPEGSRSPEGDLHRFHRGPFEIACRANVPVVPLVLRCNPSALRRGQRFWAQPDQCALLTIEIDPPVDPSKFEHKSRRMRESMQDYYRMRLGLDVGPSPR
jgi:1-acyl-sn-glycerol-3-phosphate acyltransferase